MRDKKEESAFPDEELLSRYFDGELSPEEAMKVEAHLQGDAEARGMLEQFGKTQSVLRESFHAEVSRMDFSDFWTGVEAGIDRETQRKARPVAAGPTFWERLTAWIDSLGWSQVGMGVALAAALLVTIGVTRLMDQGPEQSGQVAVNTTQGTGPATGTGESAAQVPGTTGTTGELVAGSGATPDTGGATPGTATGEGMLAQADPAQPSAPPGPEGQPALAPGAQEAPNGETARQGEHVAVAAADIDVKPDGVEVDSLAGGAGSTVMVLHSPEHATFIWVQEEEGQGGTSI